MNWYKTAQNDSLDEAQSSDKLVETAIKDISNAHTLEKAFDAYYAIEPAVKSLEDKHKILGTLYYLIGKELEKGYQGHKHLQQMLQLWKKELVPSDKWYLFHVSLGKRLKVVVIDAFSDYNNVNKDYNSGDLLRDAYCFPFNLFSDLPIYLKNNDIDIYNAAVNAICYLIKFPKYCYYMSDLFFNSRFQDDPRIRKTMSKYKNEYWHQLEYWSECVRDDIEKYVRECSSLEVIQQIKEGTGDKDNEKIVKNLIFMIHEVINDIKFKQEVNEKKFPNISKERKERTMEANIGSLISFLKDKIALFSVYNDYPEMQNLIRQARKEILIMQFKIYRMKHHPDLGFD